MMKLTDVEEDGNGDYYATVDGRDLKFTGGEGSDAEEAAQPPCDKCGKSFAVNDAGECTRVVYLGYAPLKHAACCYEDEAGVFLCNECLRDAAKV